MLLSQADQKSMARDLQRFEHDPWAFVRWAYPWGRKGTPLEKEQPRTWQRDYLCAFRDRMATWKGKPASMIDLKSTIAGNGNGKSALLSWLLEWSMMTKELTRGFATAGTEDQLRTKTWPELSKWHGMNMARHWFLMTATAYYSAIPDLEKKWRFDVQAWSKARPEAGAGLHNKGLRVMKLFDEASQIPTEIFEVAEGANTDEHTEIIHHIFGNGTRSNGYFAEATFGDKAYRWNPTSIDCRTVEGTNKLLYEQWVKEYGEDSDFVRTHVRGLLPKSSALQFIPTEFLEMAEQREAQWAPDDPLTLIVDPSRGGDDECVIRFAMGFDFRTFDPIRIPGAVIRDSSKLEAKIHDIYASPSAYKLPRKPDALIIDSTGIGGPIANHFQRAQYNVYQFIGAAESPDKTYANMRAYSWAKLRDALKSFACVDEDFYIRRDIRNQESTIDRRDKVQLILKDTMKAMGLPSPNDGDTLAMRCAFHIPQIKYPRSAWEKTANDGKPQKTYSLRDRLNGNKKKAVHRNPDFR